jgi:hypothetical protein
MREKFTLIIHFQEGFLDDTVILMLNSKEVYRKEHLTTSLLRGPTASFFTDIEKGVVHVMVSIPSKDLSDSTTFTIRSNKYLGISIVDPQYYGCNIRFIVSTEPFGYM